MKKYNRSIAFLFVVISIFASCKKDESESASSSSQSLMTFMTNGRWNITQLLDSSNDETDHFSGYEFIFTADGNATATKGINSITGNWSTQGTAGMQLLSLDFTTYPFDEITYAWHVTTQSDSLIKAEYLDDVNGGDKFLTFQKLK